MRRTEQRYGGGKRVPARGEVPASVLEKLQELLPEMAERFPALRILYIFGSQAKGKATQDSDVDLAAHFDDEAYRANPLIDIELGLFIEDRLRRPVDVVVMQRVSPILQHQVLAHGRRLFERDPEQRARLELLAFKRYVDLRHYQQKRSRIASG